MDEIPAWHFLTGSADELKAVWKAYGLFDRVRPSPINQLLRKRGTA